LILSHYWRAFCSVVLLGLFAAGCGQKGPDRVPVSGKVTLDGKPLTRGVLRVVPANAKPASSAIGEDGAFSLASYSSQPGKQPGCVLGKHRVIVNASEGVDRARTRFFAPAKYAELETTDLTVEITGPTSDLVIDLKSDGRSYPVIELTGPPAPED
jgi:hypothetical protein